MSRRVKIVVAAVVAVAMLTAGLWYGFLRGKDVLTGSPLTGLGGPVEAVLKPVKADGTGVDTASQFVLTAAKALKAADVQKMLTVQPPVEIKVEKADLLGKEYKVSPARALEPDKIYRFRLAAVEGLSRPYQWSFQTKATFRLIGTLPRNQGQGVPVNTGIEFTFSHDNFGDLASLFSISPAVDGRWERHGKTASFVPKNSLQAGTIYTVTLKKGLKQTGADGKLTDDYTFAFETMGEGGSSQPVFQAGLSVTEFATKDTPYLQVYMNRATGPLDVTVYRYKDGTAYANAAAKLDEYPWWANFSRNRYREATAGLTKVTSFQSEVKNFPNIGTYLIFPQPLEAGYYLAELKLNEDQIRQVHLQVTDLSAYISVTMTKTLAWLNDLETGAPAKGATVSVVGGKDSANAGADGVAVVPTPASAMDKNKPTGTYLLAKSGNKEAVLAAPATSGYYSYGTGLPAQYWKYVYLDRTLFKPDDQVNVWGIVRPREAGAAPVSQVTAQVVRSDYRDSSDRQIPLASVTLPVTDATFTGSVKLPGVKPGWYTLEVRMGDELLTSHWFEVATYTKPAYKVELTTDKRAVMVGDPVNVSVKASFFEGTPVPQLALNYSMGNRSGQLLTDVNGESSTTYTAEMGYDNYWGPSSIWMNVRATLPEAGEIAASSTVLAFSHDILLDTDWPTVKDGQGVVSGQATLVTLDKLNADPTSWDYRGGPAAGRKVEAWVYWQNWIREDDGETYDFIQKTVTKLYKYKEDLHEVGDFTTTTDSTGKFTLPFAAEKGKSYKVHLRVQDGQGGWVLRDLFVYGDDGYPRGRWTWYHVSTNDNTVAVGEDAVVTFQSNGAPMADRTQSYLWYTARLGLQQYWLQDSSTFHYKLRDADLPNTNIRGVYFDGRTYRDGGEMGLRVDPKAKELKMTVKPDKAAYRPGDTVKLDVTVTDQKGKPVQAQVNLNLVDEALYALQEQRVDTLGALYGEYVGGGVIRTRASHFVPSPNSGAEKGGEGGGARKDFKDAIFFSTVKTGADGKATASFQVPDNLTAWRVTYQAVRPETMEAASGTTAVPVKLPFFADIVFGDAYLVGDTPSVVARTYGTALSAGDAVSFSVAITGPDGPLGEVSSDGTAFKPATLSLPALKKAGVYTVTVSAKGPNGMKDAIEKQVTVADSFVRQTKVDFQLISDQTRLKGPDKGVATLLFSDYERGRYVRLLQQLSWQWGNRFEQKLTRSVAGAMLKQYAAGPAFRADENLNTLAYQAPDGSIAILPYADGDLKLSALAADVAPDKFDQAALRFYFEKQLNTEGVTRERQVMALYGLAALDRPVLQPLMDLLQRTDLTLEERLYTALAIAELGDLETARPVYWSMLKEHGEKIGTNVRIKDGKNVDEMVSNTALAGVLAAKLGEPETPAFAGYLLENWASDVLISVEELLIVQGALPNLASTPVSFTYVLDGKETHKELKPGETYGIPVVADRVGGLRFKDVKGQVGLALSYEAPVTIAEIKQQAGFSLKRTYSVKEPHPGDLVKITINYAFPDTAPDGEYQITDYLPAGLRLIERPWQQGIKFTQMNDPAWPVSVEGQRVTFWASTRGYPINYYARVITPGVFTAEGTVLQEQRTGIIYAHTDGAKVTIR